ncbi:MAG: hypothetical protein AAF196_20970, partial [Planctomycetota bacterium]
MIITPPPANLRLGVQSRVLGSEVVTPPPANLTFGVGAPQIVAGNNAPTVLSTLRIGQMTPHARSQVFTAMVPLPAGLISDSSQPAIRVRDLSTDQAVQVHYVNGAMKRGDGSWRIARCQFPASLAAATDPQFNYPIWADKELQFELGSADAIPTYAVHPAVDPAVMQFRFRTEIGGAWMPSIANVVSPSGPQRSWIIDPMTSEWNDYTSLGYPAQSRPRTEMADTVGSGPRWMRAYEVTKRLLPEAEDWDTVSPADPQSETEPCLLARLIYEVPSVSTGGWARAVRFWVELSNSMVTDDANPRAPQVINGRWGSTIPRLTIFNGDLTNFPADVVIYGDDAMLPGISTFAGGMGFDLSQIEDGSNGRRGYGSFHDGMSRVYQGVFYFTGGDPLTPEESETRAAILHEPVDESRGEDAVLYAIPTDLKDHDTYGAFGVVPDPVAEHGWASVDALRSDVGARLRAARDAYRTGDPWQEPQHGCLRYTAATGAQQSFGAFSGFEWAMSGHPDCRSLWLSVSQEAHRWHHHYRVDGTVMRYDDVRHPGTPTKWQSSAHFSRGQPFYSSNWNHQWPSTGPEPNFIWKLGKWGAGSLSGTLSSPRGTSGNGWSGYDYEHFVLNQACAAAYLTGDRWVLDVEMKHLRNVAMCSRQTPQDLESGEYVWSQVGTGVPRSEGRWLRSVAHVVTLETDPTVLEDFFQKLHLRAEALAYWGSSDNQGQSASSRFGNRKSSLFTDYAATSEDNTRYFTNNNEHFLCGSDPLTLAWPSSAQNEPSSNGWQEGLQCMGMWAGRVVAQHDPSNIRGAVTISELDFSLREFTRGWPQFGYELVGGQWFSPFVIFRDISPTERGARIPVESYGDVTRFCNSSDQLRTSGALWGPQIGHNGGVPQFQRGSATWNRWSCALILLANFYHPDDPAVQAAIQERLANNPIYIGPDARRSEFLAVPDNSINFFAVIPDPFTAPAADVGTGIINGSGSATAMVSASATSLLVRDGSGAAVVSTLSASGPGVLAQGDTDGGGTAVATCWFRRCRHLAHGRSHPARRLQPASLGP